MGQWVAARSRCNTHLHLIVQFRWSWIRRRRRGCGQRWARNRTGSCAFVLHCARRSWCVHIVRALHDASATCCVVVRCQWYCAIGYRCGWSKFYCRFQRWSIGQHEFAIAEIGFAQDGAGLTEIRQRCGDGCGRWYGRRRRRRMLSGCKWTWQLWLAWTYRWMWRWRWRFWY